MKNFTYQQLVSMISYYLWKYPSVIVALECVLEDVENDPETSKEIQEVLQEAHSGEKDFKVLLNWADRTNSLDVRELGEKIEEAYRRKEDIGYFVRRFVPVATTEEDMPNFEKPYYKGKRKKFK